MLWHGRSLSFKQSDEPLGVCFFWTCVISMYFFLCVLVKDLQVVELALYSLVKTKQMWKFGLPDVLAVGRTSR